jgi:ferritin-like metal-binding protein YciE
LKEKLVYLLGEWNIKCAIHKFCFEINTEVTMKVETLRDLYLEQLQDLYNAEQQLIKALPKMAKAATSEELRTAFEEHLEQTKGHAERIETICEQMGEKASGKKCKAMEGLVKEGSETIDEDMEDNLKDAALIADAQRVEHYEIAGYGCVHAYATKLGDEEAADLLAQTLEEEKETDLKLNGIAEELDLESPAETEDETEVEAEDQKKVTGRPSKAGRTRRVA